jgi:hypothetical protein
MDHLAAKLVGKSVTILTLPPQEKYKISYFTLFRLKTRNSTFSQNSIIYQLLPIWLFLGYRFPTALTLNPSFVKNKFPIANMKIYFKTEFCF